MITIRSGLSTQSVGGGVVHKLQVISLPNKIEYKEGEHLDLTGLVIGFKSAKNSNPSIITNYNTFPANNTILSRKNTSIEIEYIFEDNIYTTYIPIVVKYPVSINIVDHDKYLDDSKNVNLESFKYEFVYNDGSKADFSGSDYNNITSEPAVGAPLGNNKKIKIIYNDGGFNTKTYFNISTSGRTYSHEGAAVKIVTFASGALDEIKTMAAAHRKGVIDIRDYWKVGDKKYILDGYTYMNKWMVECIGILVIVNIDPPSEDSRVKISYISTATEIPIFKKRKINISNNGDYNIKYYKEYSTNSNYINIKANSRYLGFIEHANILKHIRINDRTDNIINITGSFPRISEYVSASNVHNSSYIIGDGMREQLYSLPIETEYTFKYVEFAFESKVDKYISNLDKRKFVATNKTGKFKDFWVYPSIDEIFNGELEYFKIISNRKIIIDTHVSSPNFYKQTISYDNNVLLRDVIIPNLEGNVTGYIDGNVDSLVQSTVLPNIYYFNERNLGGAETIAAIDINDHNLINGMKVKVYNPTEIALNAHLLFSI